MHAALAPLDATHASPSCPDTPHRMPHRRVHTIAPTGWHGPALFPGPWFSRTYDCPDGWHGPGCRTYGFPCMRSPWFSRRETLGLVKSYKTRSYKTPPCLTSHTYFPLPSTLAANQQRPRCNLAAGPAGPPGSRSSHRSIPQASSIRTSRAILAARMHGLSFDGSPCCIPPWPVRSLAPPSPVHDRFALRHVSSSAASSSVRPAVCCTAIHTPSAPPPQKDAANCRIGVTTRIHPSDSSPSGGNGKNGLIWASAGDRHTRHRRCAYTKYDVDNSRPHGPGIPPDGRRCGHIIRFPVEPCAAACFPRIPRRQPGLWLLQLRLLQLRFLQLWLGATPAAVCGRADGYTRQHFRLHRHPPVESPDPASSRD